MKVTYQSEGWTPERVKQRYVRKLPTGEYLWAEVGEDARFNIRQGTITGEKLPASVREAADALADKVFSYVMWKPE